jgi:hypothetical protein
VSAKPAAKRASRWLYPRSDKQERRRQERENRIAAEEIKKVIEKEASLPPVERIWVGDRGYWIEKHGEPAGDGRQKFLVWSPEGELLSMIWGKDAAERAAESEIGSRK